jgi:hypothetical protein
VLLVIKGAVDTWRRNRQLSYNLYCAWVKDPIDIFSYQSLPFDSELIDIIPVEDIAQWHSIASKELTNFEWPQGKN